jgi:arginase family enzyme
LVSETVEEKENLNLGRIVPVCPLVENLNIKAFDIVEVSPKLDSNDITSWLALKTIYEVLNTLREKL